MSETNSVVIFTKASEMLAQADTIQKTKELKDLALTAADWARRKGMGEEAVRYARNYALEAIRKMGMLLKETERAKGGNPNLPTGNMALPVAPTLAELGISKRESSIAQQLAELPDEEFEEIKKGEISLTSGLKKETAHVGYNTGENEWYTPAYLIQSARDTMGGIDCDPASSEQANETVKAKKFYTVETDGLMKNWNAMKWMNPPPCTCNVQPNGIYYKHGNEDLYSLSEKLAAYINLFLQKETSGKIILEIVVPRLRERIFQIKTTDSTIKSRNENEIIKRKEKICTKPKGTGEKKNSIQNLQSPKKTKKIKHGLDLDDAGMGASETGMGTSVCLLRIERNFDTRSFHTAIASFMSGNNSVKHGASLPILQFTQGIADAHRLVRGQAAYCPNCGVVGYAITTTSKIYCNPPYSQPLIGYFSNAIVERYAFGEVTEACVLVNNATETEWLQNMLTICNAVCFVKGRVKFLDINGKPGAPLQGQVVIYMGKNSRLFTENFSEYGVIFYREI